jgi:hypothetical protein
MFARGRREGEGFAGGEGADGYGSRNFRCKHLVVRRAVVAVIGNVLRASAAAGRRAAIRVGVDVRVFDRD